MAAISKMTPAVAVNFPDCPEPMIEDYLLQAAIDFCQRTYAWNETERETLTSADFPFDVSPPSGGQVHKVVAVFDVTNDLPLESTEVRDLDLSVNNWRITTGTPQKFVEESCGTVTVVSLPSASAEFDITTAYEPTATSKTIPDALYNKHRYTIISGAIARLAVTSRWFNKNLASEHGGVYEEGVSRALVSFHTSHVLTSMNVATSPI